MADEFKYKAFISYSHSDEKWATWLHRSLEAYRPPKPIVGNETPMGKIPARLSPVFRDRDELPSATNLGELLTESLRQSATQIVICSPAAAKSHWVNEEILTFKRLGRSKRIFCLIVGGEPWASNKPGQEDEECFPPALRYEIGEDKNLSDVFAEPIAADARPEGDGKFNGRLKLISGMLGVGFDALKQREASRRHRRMLIFSTALLIGMTITSGLAVTAYLARNEAEEQRNRAEAEAETAKQTTQFMVGLFSVSDPSESLGNTITAREILDKGAERIEDELAGQPAIQATLMDTMGTVYTSLGLYDAAVPLVRNALNKRRALLGNNSLEVAQSLNHLGEVQMLMADYEDSVVHLRDALAVRRELLGNNAPEVAETLTDLADVLSRQGEFAEAEPLIRESLAIRRKVHGEQHPEVAESLEDLALSLLDQGDFESPVPLLREAVAMRRELQGELHPDLGEAVNNLGFALLEKGDLDEAEEYFRESLDMARKLLGEEHPEVAMAMNNVAYVLHSKGDYAAAEPMYEQQLRMQRNLLGDDHPDVAMALNNLAFLYRDMKQPDRAIEYAKQSLDMKRRVLGDEHPAVSRSMNSVAMWLMENDDYDAAEILLRESLDMDLRLLGDAHADTGSSMTLLASCLVDTGRFEEGLELAGRARAILVDALPAGHWRTAVAMSVEGAAFAGLREFGQAETLLVDSYEILQNDEAALPLFVTVTAERLVTLYTNWNKPEKAEIYRAMLRTQDSR